MPLQGSPSRPDILLARPRSAFLLRSQIHASRLRSTAFPASRSIQDEGFHEEPSQNSTQVRDGHREELYLPRRLCRNIPEYASLLIQAQSLLIIILL